MHSARSRKMAQGPHSHGALPDPGRNLGLGWKPARAPHPLWPNPAQKATWQRWPSDPIRRLSVDIGRSKPAAAAHLRNPSSILFFPFSFFTRAAAGRRLQLGSVRWRRQRLSRWRAARSGHGSRAGDLGSSLSIFPPFFFSRSNGAAAAHGWPSRWRQRPPDPSAVRALTQGWARRRRAV